MMPSLLDRSSLFWLIFLSLLVFAIPSEAGGRSLRNRVPLRVTNERERERDYYYKKTPGNNENDNCFSNQQPCFTTCCTTGEDFTCCPGYQSSGVCAPNNTFCCGDDYCANGTTCCPNSPQLCYDATSTCCGTTACTDQEHCCSNQDCCPIGKSCCGDSCCDGGINCCGDACCKSSVDQCCGDECCDSEQNFCCGGETCCLTTHSCCGTDCCAGPEIACCGDTCCDTRNGSFICAENTCLNCSTSCSYSITLDPLSQCPSSCESSYECGNGCELESESCQSVAMSWQDDATNYKATAVSVTLYANYDTNDLQSVSVSLNGISTSFVLPDIFGECLTQTYSLDASAYLSGQPNSLKITYLDSPGFIIVVKATMNVTIEPVQ